MTGIEGLWPHNLSPNRLIVLERKLVLWLQAHNYPTNPGKDAHDWDDVQNLLQTAAAHNCDFTELREIIKRVVSSSKEDLISLAQLAELDITQDFAGAKMLGVDLSNCDLTQVNLQGAYLRGAELSDTDLSEANLQAANLQGADLSGALLSNANLQDADLHRASLALANLSGANLSDANLSNANLSNANLSNANLSNANFTDADLSHAGLVLSNLANINWTNTKVEMARLWHDAGLSEENKQVLIRGGAIFEEIEEDQKDQKNFEI